VRSRGRKGVSDRSLAWLFLAASLCGAWFTWNALRPMAGPSRRGVVSFFAGWLTGELALHHLAWQFGMTLVFARAGALRAWPGLDWRHVLVPFPIRHPEVERVRDVVYARAGGRDLKLDVYRHRNHPAGCPTLLQIHGGAWILGSKNEQGLPLMHHLAARGWVGVAADYRL